MSGAERHSPCHQFAVGIDMMIPHIQTVFGVADRDKMAGDDVTAAVVGCDDTAGLVVVKDRVAVDLTGLGILNRSEFTAVITDLARHPRSLV